ncbi:MAG: hypothetical protein K8T91_20075 [Planctomycetes bacterium]|nr:hypothetical protein [Planctomycetota bacterium]
MKLDDFLNTKVGRAIPDPGHNLRATVNHWSNLLGEPVTTELATVENFIAFRDYMRKKFCRATAKHYINRARHLLAAACPDVVYPRLPDPIDAKRRANGQWRIPAGRKKSIRSGWC